MGQHVWLLLATIGTELLVIAKWSQGQFPEPLPTRVRWAWSIGAFLLVLYPTVRVRGLPGFYVEGQLTRASRGRYSSVFRRRGDIYATTNVMRKRKQRDATEGSDGLRCSNCSGWRQL